MTVVKKQPAKGCHACAQCGCVQITRLFQEATPVFAEYWYWECQRCYFNWDA